MRRYGNGLIDADLAGQISSPAETAAYEDARNKEKAELGKALFLILFCQGRFYFMRDLPQSGLVVVNGLARAIGDASNVMQVRAPTLIDIYQLPRLGWDGKFRNIEAVTFAAITSPANMNLPETTGLV